MRAEYPDEFEAFCEALAMEWYGQLSGRRQRLDLEPVYGRYSDLFRREEIDELARDADEAFLTRDAKAFRYLRAAAVDAHLGARVRRLVEEVADHDARATVDLSGLAVALRAVPVLVANEPRRDARRELARRAASRVEETSDLEAERIETLHDGARDLDADSYLSLLADARGVDYSAVAGDAAKLLAETERPFAESLEQLFASHLDLRLADAEASDAARLFRLAGYDAAFPASRLVTVYRDTLAGLGIRAGRQPNVTLDLEERPAKIAHAFAAAVELPERIVLVARPAGGYASYAALFGAVGGVQRAAFTSPDVRVAFARAGDRGPGDAFGALFRNLLFDADWLAEFAGRATSRDFRTAAGVHRGYAVRRDAARAIYEVELHAGRLSLADAAERYAELVGEATRVPVSRGDALREARDLRAADALRGAALEVLLRDAFKTRYGRRWWASRAAGDLLKELWATGNEYTLDELAVEMGLGSVSTGALADDLAAGVEP
jgi:hypothetical protein